MFETIRQWLDDVTQDKRIVFLMGIIAFGAVAIILASGSFDVQLGQLFAGQCSMDAGDDCNDICPSGAGYCDGGTCVCEDDPAQSNEPCTPVTATGWGGFPDVTGTGACKPYTNPSVTPPPVPSNWEAHASLQGGLTSGQPYDCFGFSIDGADNEWAAIDASQGGAVPPGGSTFTLRGQVFNNCPWPVEMSLGAAGNPTAGNDYIFNDDGTIDPPEPPAGLDEIMTRVAPTPGTLVPSCWNYPHVQTSTTAPAGTTPGGASSPPAGGGGGNGHREGGEHLDFEPSLIRPVAQVTPGSLFRLLFGSHAYAQANALQPGCNVAYEARIDLGRFNAGRVEVSLGWRHHDGKGSAPPGGVSHQDGYNIVINYGQNCTGAPGQECAGAGAGGGTYGSGGGPTKEECEDGNPWDDKPEGYEGTYDDLDPGTQRKCNDAHQACYSVWPMRKFHRVEACTGGEPWSYNGFTGQQWGQYIRGWERWIEENCGGWEDGTTSLDDLLASYDEFTAPFEAMEIEGPAEEGGRQFNDEGITCVCRCPVGACMSFHYFICNTTHPDDTNCEQPTLACFVGGDVNNEEHDHCKQFGYIDRDGDGRCEPPGSEVPVACGDGTCSDDETCVNCSADCGTCPGGAVCGDGVCDFGESCSTCDEDCGYCSETCGDDVCDSGETCATCASDCGSCVTITPTPTPTTVSVTITPRPGTGVAGTGGTGAGTGGQVGGAGAVPTGPGETTMLAFLLAALTALLYVSYTHTDMFKEREAKRLGEDQGPMDFRQ